MAVGRDAESQPGTDLSTPRHASRADEPAASEQREGVEPVPADPAVRGALRALLQLPPERVREVREQVSRRRARRGRAGPYRDYGAH